MVMAEQDREERKKTGTKKKNEEINEATLE